MIRPGLVRDVYAEVVDAAARGKDPKLATLRIMALFIFVGLRPQED
jgi:hypothetical protein